MNWKPTPLIRGSELAKRMLLVLFLLLLSASAKTDDANDAVDDNGAADSAKDNDTPYMWSCDDMTPDLCLDDMVMTQHEVPVSYTKEDDAEAKNLEATVTYFRYQFQPNHDNDGTRLPPLLVINGGPGLPHDYMLPMRQLVCRDGQHRDVIFYDQAGSGASLSLTSSNGEEDEEEDPSVYTIDYFAMVELPAILEHAGLLKNDQNNNNAGYHLVGSSFGTMLAMHWLIHSSPDSKARRLLRSVTMLGPIPSAHDIVQDAWDADHGLIGKYTNAYMRQRLREMNQSQSEFETDEFEAITWFIFTSLYVRGVFPDCAMASFQTFNPAIFATLEGPADFLTWTGSLQGVDMVPELKNVANGLKDLPVLITRGEFDVVSDRIMRQVQSAFPLSETFTFARASHNSLLDETKLVLDTQADFLRRVDEAHENGGTFVPKLEQQQPTTLSGSSREVSMLTFCVTAVAALLVGLLVGRWSVGRMHQYERIGSISLHT